MQKILLFAGFVLFLANRPVGAYGQSDNSPQQKEARPGDRIRLKVEGMPSLTGKYDSFTGDSVAISLGGGYNFITMFIPKDKIQKIEISKSRSSSLKKIVIGTLIGASAGVIFGLVVPDSPTLDHGGFYYWTREGTMMLWGAIGAGGGLIVGTGVAALGHERWIPATLGKPLEKSTSLPGITVGWRFCFGN